MLLVEFMNMLVRFIPSNAFSTRNVMFTTISDNGWTQAQRMLIGN